jgi:hypothetical protein
MSLQKEGTNSYQKEDPKKDSRIAFEFTLVSIEEGKIVIERKKVN